MSMLVQQAKRRIPALVGAQTKVAAFAPSLSTVPLNSEHSNHYNNTNNNNDVNNSTTNSPSRHPTQPSPPKPPPTLTPEPEVILSTPSPSPSDNNAPDTISISPPPSSPKPFPKRVKENSPNVQRVSNERIFHGKSFDARVEALKHLLTSSHFATLFRATTTTPSQADQLLEQAQLFKIDDYTLYHSYLRFYSRRGNVAQVMRTVERMRARGIAYNDQERVHIDRAHRKAQEYGALAFRTDVVRGWVQIGDAEMCVRCYDAMRAAGTHPGASGYTSLMRIFAERGDSETNTRLLKDMDDLGVKAHSLSGVKINGEEEGSLGLSTFKSLLRFHANLAERDVCERLQQEMQSRGIEEDDEVREIVASIGQRELEKEREDEETVQQPIVEKKSKKATTTKQSHPQTTQFSTQQLTTNQHPTSSNATTSPTTIPQQPLKSKTEFEIAMEAFERARNGEIPSTAEYFNGMLKMAAHAGDGVACDKLLAAMDARGVERTQETFAYAIDAQKDDHACCEALFNSMRAHGFASPRSAHARTAYNAMLWVYCAERRVEDAISLFEEMREHEMADTAAYNTLMRVYASDGNLQSVMSLSADMKRKGVVHDISTYNIMVEVLGKYGVKGLMVVDAVVREMQQSNLHMDVVMYDTLMDIYGAAGQWEKCEGMWKDMGERGIVLGAGSCARFLEKHCRRDPNLYVKWKKAFSGFLPP